MLSLGERLEMDAGPIISVRNFDLLHLIFYPSHHILSTRERKGEGRGEKEHKSFSLKQKEGIASSSREKSHRSRRQNNSSHPPKREEEGSQLGEIYVVNFTGSNSVFIGSFEGSIILGA